MSRLHVGVISLIVSFFAVFVSTSTAFALTVSPAKLEITGDPGTTVYGDIEVFNEQADTKVFYSSFENFEPAGDSGSPHFIGAKDGLATWMQTSESITLFPSQREKIPFTITIPEGTEPGGYFSALFWGSSAPEQTGVGGEVSIGGKIGVLILLRVSGNVEEDAGILDFGTKEQQRVFTSLPIHFTYRMNNNGGDRIVPLGDVTIKNTIRLTSETLSANKNEGSVLPGSIRKFESVWGDDAALAKETGFISSVKHQWKEFHVGWYTANLHVVWGETNTVEEESFHFFIFPWQLLLILLVSISTVGFFAKIGIKKYNTWIIAKATMAQPSLAKPKRKK